MFQKVPCFRLQAVRARGDGKANYLWMVYGVQIKPFKRFYISICVRIVLKICDEFNCLVAFLFIGNAFDHLFADILSSRNERPVARWIAVNATASAFASVAVGACRAAPEAHLIDLFAEPIF
jgi:hypothetical protein